MKEEVKKEYQKPEVIVILLNTQEEIVTDDYVDGELGLESSIF